MTTRAGESQSILWSVICMLVRDCTIRLCNSSMTLLKWRFLELTAITAALQGMLSHACMIWAAKALYHRHIAPVYAQYCVSLTSFLQWYLLTVSPGFIDLSMLAYCMQLLCSQHKHIVDFLSRVLYFAPFCLYCAHCSQPNLLCFGAACQQTFAICAQLLSWLSSVLQVRTM